MVALCFLLLFLFKTFALLQCELFTALVDLEKLLYTEGEIVRTLDQYLAVEEQRLQKVRRLQEQFDKLHQQASTDTETFLSNPVNAYLLVKRLTADWWEAEYLIYGLSGKALIENITTHRHDLQFPDEEDLNGAAVALMRLQDTYKLDTASLARGIIEGTDPSPELTAGDCYELGRQAHNAGDWYHSVLWMQESHERLTNETNTAEEVDVLEYIAYAEYMQGNIKHALKLTNDVLELVPGHTRASDNAVFYANALSELGAKKKGDEGDVPHEPNNKGPAITEMEYHRNKPTYEQLCRGEKPQPKKRGGPLLNALFPKEIEENVLHCRYYTNDNPFLFIQPVKEEELNLDPRIVMYHNFLSENEMNIIKWLAQPNLQRATVQNADSKDMETATYRISKSAWLKDEDHLAIARISQRIEAVTNLVMNTAEDLQVVNYGIGGHYEPHYDFASGNDAEAFKGLGTGNRIATWLNYMSTVDAGGATVFPEIGAIVRPIKGSSAFWYNLLKNGEGDYRTKHAACPVLAGTKWVSNKWMHVYGQESRRKCGLNAFE